MFNVVICVDDIEVSNTITKSVSQFFSQHKVDGKISLITTEPQKVIEYVKNNFNQVNIYFFDLFFNASMNGLILGKEVRKRDLYGYLVYITGHPEFTLKTFQYNLRALDYISNVDNIRERINQSLEAIVNKHFIRNQEAKKKILFIQSGDKSYSILQDTIISAETTLQHKIRIHTLYGDYEVTGNLSDIEDKLGEDFYRCHKSYLINTKLVNKICTEKNDLSVTMINGSKCLISRRTIKGVIDYIKGDV